MTGIVQGNDCLIELHDGDTYRLFVCAKDMTISPKTTYVNIATYGDGMWDKWSPQSHGYTISLSGVAAFKDSAMTVWDMIDRQLQGLETKFRAVYTDAEGNNTRVMHGYVFIDSSSVTANVGQVALGDLSLLGNGALKISACSVMVSSLNVEVTGNDIEVTADADGDPAYYVYQVDNNLEETTVVNPFTIPDIAGGFHTILVTPVCTGDNRGLEVSADFYIEVNAPTTSCPNVTGLSISSITRDSFTVSWTRPAGADTVDLYIKNLTTQTEIPFLGLTVSTKDITGLSNNTTYSARVVTNCNDATQSGGVSVNGTTLPPASPVRMQIQNNNPLAVLNSVDINPTEGPLDIQFGSFPLVEPQMIILRNLPLGARNVVFFFDSAVTGNITVTAESGSETQAISGGNSFDLTIGTGGINVTIDP